MSNSAKGNVLVAIQFVLLATIFLLPSGNAWATPLPALVAAFAALAVGAVAAIVALITLGKSLSANPVPVAAGELKTSGVYGLVRHPVYSGIMIGVTGYAVLRGSWFVLLAVAALVVLFSVKARFEERLLSEKYPEYEAYAARVGRFVPGIGRRR